MFIVIEGVDGAGKTSVIQEMKSRLGDNCVVTREPGGTPFAEKLRGILLDDYYGTSEVILLFFAARINHLRTVILPALESGKTVICDRFSLSTYLYQVCNSSNQEEAIDLFKYLQDKVANLTIPVRHKSHLVVLDVRPEIAVARLQHRPGQINHFDSLSADVIDSRRSVYLNPPSEITTMFSSTSFFDTSFKSIEETASSLLQFFGMSVK